MKSNFIYSIVFLSLLLFVNCGKNEKKKTSNSNTIETQLASQDSTAAKTLEEIETTNTKIPHHFICYTNDDTPSIQLSIAFNDAGNALFVKYKGQENSIPLKNVKEDYDEGGAYPTITQFYDEIYDGNKNGTYELTHSGNWDYVVYRSIKNEKVFKFTIDHDATVVGGEYRKMPCFK